MRGDPETPKKRRCPRANEVYALGRLERRARGTGGDGGANAFPNTSSMKGKRDNTGQKTAVKKPQRI